MLIIPQFTSQKLFGAHKCTNDKSAKINKHK